MDDSRPLCLRSDRLHWRPVEGEILALDASSEEYLALNQSATLLWEMLVVGCSRAELTERLVSAYSLEGEQAAQDVDRLLSELEERGLLADAPG